jgi:signal transduction histidine kinase/CheY-like chemotaxis protein
MTGESVVPYRSPAAVVDDLLHDLETHVRALVEASIGPDFPSGAAREEVAAVAQAAEALARAVASGHRARAVEERQVDQILDVLSGLAALDFSRRVETQGDSGKVDAVAMMTNLLSEELAASQQELAERSQALRRAKEAAEAATAAKSQFLANMSHEIRTPLTALLGFADLLGAHRISEADRLSYAQIIRRNGEHLLSLMNDILDLSKIEAGRLEVTREDSSLSEALSGVISLMRVRATEEGLEFGLHLLTPIPAVVRTDPVRLRQILLNLVGNAIKFTEAGSVRILVRYDARAAPPRLAVDVVDTGIGMSAEQMALIFQPFQQADPSMSRRYGGTGLGLAICRPLAEALGGTLSARSVLGEGSTFTLSLAVVVPPGTPLVQSIGEHAPRHADSSRPPSSERFTGSVLLAEDGPDNQLLVTTLLRNLGITVAVVENGQEAVTRALEARSSGAPYDMVLMDMQMPVLDGYGAATELRRKGYRGSIVALTAHAMTGERERCLAAGCDDYLQKPIDRVALSVMLGEHLRRTPDHEPAPLHSTLSGDPQLAEILPQFVRSLGGRAAALRAAAQRHDLDTLRRLAHQIKGAAGGYGFPLLGEAAERLERAIDEDERSSEIEVLLDDLLSVCGRARV